METSPSDQTLNWIVLTTHPHREDFAIENLVRQDYEAYCPMIVKRIKHARRTYDAKRPLFSGYVFVERPAQCDLWRPLLGTFGVRFLLRQRGYDRLCRAYTARLSVSRYLAMAAVVDAVPVLVVRTPVLELPDPIERAAASCAPVVSPDCTALDKTEKSVLICTPSP